MIKTKDIKPRTIDKTVSWTRRVKKPNINTKDVIEDNTKEQENEIDYGDEKIKYATQKLKDGVVYTSKDANSYIKDRTTSIIKNKNTNLKQVKNSIKSTPKNTIKNSNRFVKTVKNTTKNSEKLAKESAKATRIMVEQGRKLAIKTTKITIKLVKTLYKILKAIIKGMISAIKGLGSMLAAGGTAAVIAIIIICLVALLLASIYGIFFSSEEISPNAITMKSVISECNNDFSNKLETIQKQNSHDEYVLEGNMASWRDILLIYTIKQTNGKNEQEVLTIDDNKKKIIKQIFWDMNEITYQVKKQVVETSVVNTSDKTESQEKKVLHIYIKNKTVDDMKNKYKFNQEQLKQLNELSDNKYASLWNGVIYGSVNSGEYINWRQGDSSWANIKIGNSGSTLGRIGCLVTSIAILIKKSSINTSINPFNPGTFVEALNKNNEFDNNGNLLFAGITKVIPNFKFAGNINLRGKTKEEKLTIIKQYLDLGYYLTVEVKGATPGHQHWVAVIDIQDNSVIMVDPASNQTNMWNAYNYEKTSQFNYFKVEG